MVRIVKPNWAHWFLLLLALVLLGAALVQVVR